MIAIVNSSTLVTPAEATAMVDTVHTQIVSHFAPAWSRLPARPKLFGSLLEVPPGTPLLLLVDDSDDPGALGFHTETMGGRVTGIVAARPVLDAGGGILHGDLSVSSVLSHEVVETHNDPWCTSWAQAPDGTLWALETADPVQGDSYAIGGISVSNFILPRFLDGQAPPGSKFDWLGRLSKPFSLGEGGYAVVMSGGSVATIGDRPAWRAGYRSGKRQTS